jgi:ribosomal protein S6
MAKKEAEMRDDEAMLDEGGGPRVYELGFHLDPELPSEEVKKAYQAIKEVIEGAGSVVAEGQPEQIQLAYTISRQEPAGRRDFDTAYFSWIAYECDAGKHAEVAEAAKADARIVRFIDILTTKEAARHAAEMKALSMKAPAPESEAPVSEAELDAALEEVAV